MIIYLLTNKINGKIYVGKTVLPLEKRWQQHCRAALRGAALHLSQAIRKYGSHVFTVEQLAEAKTGEELNLLERKFIRKLRANFSDVGYNMTTGGDGFAFGNTHRRGTRLTEEHKQKISRAASYPRSEETRARMSAAQYGHECSEETRRKMSSTHKGRKHGPMPESQKEKIREAQVGKILSAQHLKALREAGKCRRGIPLSDEHRAKLCVSRGPCPEARKEKIRVALKGKSFTKKHRDAISRGKRGTTLTAEHRAKIAEGVRKARAAE